MAFQQINTGDKNLQLIQANIRTAIATINSLISTIQVSSFQGGVLLSGISIGSSQTSISHGLNRIPKIFVVSDLNTNSVIWRSAISDQKNIYLTASTACIASLWVS